MKLMSLFDGSGGFPLAASLCGIEPVYASEVEPYPIAVTKSRFPNMKHLGDVSRIKGAEIEPVDIITFGSPCQDMSVAGKRAGLKHTAVGDEETTRSGLFMEAIRIIKEMRVKTNGIYPRFAVWENVPGAFSSNRGEDFRLVLEEFIRISEPNAVMPAVPQAGWAYADCINGDGWSVAYRTFDAQYWGVPQRRRRIYLVADFRGGRAGEILFKREGLRGHTAQSGTQGQETARCAKNSVGTAIGGVDRYNQSFLSGLAQTLRASGGGDCTPTVLAPVAVYCHQGNGIDRAGKCLTAYSFDSLSSNSMKSKNPHSGCRAVEIAKTLDTGYPDPSKNQGGIAIVEKIILDDQGGQQISVRTDGKSPTLRAEAHGNVPCVINKKTLVYDARGNGDGETVPTITGDHNNRVTDYTALCCETIPIHDQATRFSGKRGQKQDGKGNGLGVGQTGDPMNTLTAADRHAVCYTMQEPIAAAIGCRNLRETGNIYGTLQAKPNGGQSLNYSGAVRVNYIVRRLTPTECARLQGFPDKWGHPDKKEDFTEEEYKFWLEVRNTYAKINGKSEKEYTKAQMLTWYSKLHTDSAEYKMWGNGIALPNALYVMQGIVTEVDNR
jgi:DNA (cytosine-5)-methyltransferase 1